MTNETEEYFSKNFETLNRKIDQIGNMVYELQKENAVLKSIIAKLLPAEQLGNYPTIEQQQTNDNLAQQFK